MKAIVILLDSVNRRFLSLYGTQREQALTPNLERLAQRGMVFENHWCGSAPCMPARRDMLTGRLNFLERPWGGIEPFDHVLPALLRENNVYTHMETDHFHYSERGGENYWGAFTSWNLHRGAEHDTIFWGPDQGGIPKPERPSHWCGVFSPAYQSTAAHYAGQKERFSTVRVFDAATAWLEKASTADNFLLWVEGFSPHEPFDVPQEFLDLYPGEPDGAGYWPAYDTADHHTPEELQTFRRRYKALLSMADQSLGKLLDVMDRQDLWRDTAVIFTTDHGYMLGEHGFMAKNYMPDYNEVYHIPLIAVLPGQPAGRCKALTQNIDLFPTLLEWFGVDRALCRNPVHGKSLLPLLRRETEQVRRAALFGMFGKTVSVTDGDFVYTRAPGPDNQPLHIYGSTLTVLNRYLGYDSIAEEDFDQITMGTLAWTRFPVYVIPASLVRSTNSSLNFARLNRYVEGHKLYDLRRDYSQTSPVTDPALEAHYAQLLAQTMALHDAPNEQFIRLGLQDDERGLL